MIIVIIILMLTIILTVLIIMMTNKLILSVMVVIIIIRQRPDTGRASGDNTILTHIQNTTNKHMSGISNNTGRASRLPDSACAHIHIHTYAYTYICYDHY